MNRTSAVALGIVLLCACADADPPAAGKPFVPTADLPRIGTVGDVPAEPSVEVSIAADGGVYVEGALCELADVRRLLAEKAAAPGMKEPDTGSSRLSVVLRVAAASRWDVVTWVLQTAASPSVKAYRVFFAVRAEEDDTEGAIATFLPRDGSFRSPRPRRRAVRLEVDGTSTETAQAPSFAAIRAAVEKAGDGAVGLVRPSADASMGAVLEAADLLFRAGVTTVHWHGNATKPPPIARVPRPVGAPTEIQKHVAAAGPAAPGRRIWILALGTPPTTDSAPAPKVARVRGRVAGATDVDGVFVERDSDVDWRAKSPFRPEVQRAVDSGLLWLAAHQSQDGGWESHGFAKWCKWKSAEPTVDGIGRAGYDVGATGLALLAFLGAGYTNRSDDANGFGKTVASGLRYLKNVQQADGCFGPQAGTHYLYSHAIASLAMLEAYARTRSSVYKNSTKKSLEFTAHARNPERAWRYGVRPGDNDTSVTFWAALGLHTAKRAVADEVAEGWPPPFVVDDAALQGVAAWLDEATDPETGRVGYASRSTGPSRYGDAVQKFPAEKSESMTAVGTFLLLTAGRDAASSPLRRSLALIDRLPPSWNPADGSIDLSYWHPAALAMAARGGDTSKSWMLALEKALLSSQRTDTDVCAALGSWDPVDPWGGEGGRIYSTATACLCLEAPARVARLLRREK